MTAAPDAGEDSERSYLIRVFYATDRIWSGSRTSPKFYTGESRSDNNLELGFCFVSIPPSHQTGHLERPSWWKLEFSENPDRHVVLTNAVQKDREDFYSQLARENRPLNRPTGICLRARIQR